MFGIEILVVNGAIKNALTYRLDSARFGMSTICGIDIIVYSPLFDRVPIKVLTKPMLDGYVTENPEVRRVLALISFFVPR
jgi:hypothetical protein